MAFGILKRWQRAARAKRSLASLEAKVDGLERTHGFGFKRSDQLPRSPVEHVKDAPFESKEFWVKQINQERLTNVGRAALGAAFVGFGDSPSDEQARRQYAEMMSTHLVQFEVDPTVQRRYAGDHTLPRGRYHAICDEHGNDEGTLVGELRAYYEPERVGVVHMFDCTLPADLEKVRAIDIPAGDPNQLIFQFAPINGNANPFVMAFFDLIGKAHLAQPCESLVISVGLPLSIRKIRREKVLDLRVPSTGAWLARTLSTLKWRVHDEVMPCFPRRPRLEQFVDLLPELLVQENGGGGTCVAAGVLLRYLGADGLIFPSARNDVGVLIEGGAVVDHHGWNFVDYADTSPPDFAAWIEQGKHWPTQIGFRPYADAPGDETPVWYPEVTLISHPNGSWQAEGLRRRINLTWRKKLLRYALNCSRGQLSELAWGTLYVFPELLANNGKIDFAGEISKLVFESALGIDDAGARLAELREQFRGMEDLRQSIGELLDKVHRPSCEKWTKVMPLYIPWQGIDSDQ